MKRIKNQRQLEAAKDQYNALVGQLSALENTPETAEKRAGLLATIQEIQFRCSEYRMAMADTDSGDSDPLAPDQSGAPLVPQWERDDRGDYRAHIETRALETRALMQHSPPTGSAVRGAGLPTIWQARPEMPGNWLMRIPRADLVGSDSEDAAGSAYSVEITGLQHDIVADGADPALSGSAKATQHAADYRATLTKIGVPQRVDVADLDGVLNNFVREIYYSELFKSIVAALAGAANEVKTGKATALPDVANTPGKLVDLALGIRPQYRAGSVMLINDALLGRMYDWSQTAAAARGIVDFVGMPESRLFDRETQSTNLTASGGAASDESAYCFDPTCLTIFESGMINSRMSFSATTGSWYLYVGSRYKVSLLDAAGAAKLVSKA